MDEGRIAESLLLEDTGMDEEMKGDNVLLESTEIKAEAKDDSVMEGMKMEEDTKGKGTLLVDVGMEETKGVLLEDTRLDVGTKDKGVPVDNMEMDERMKNEGILLEDMGVEE